MSIKVINAETVRKARRKEEREFRELSKYQQQARMTSSSGKRLDANPHHKEDFKKPVELAAKGS
jgi:hypothetical protein